MQPFGMWAPLEKGVVSANHPRFMAQLSPDRGNIAQYIQLLTLPFPAHLLQNNYKMKITKANFVMPLHIIRDPCVVFAENHKFVALGKCFTYKDGKCALSLAPPPPPRPHYFDVQYILGQTRSIEETRCYILAMICKPSGIPAGLYSQSYCKEGATLTGRYKMRQRVSTACCVYSERTVSKNFTQFLACRLNIEHTQSFYFYRSVANEAWRQSSHYSVSQHHMDVHVQCVAVATITQGREHNRPGGKAQRSPERDATILVQLKIAILIGPNIG